MSNEVFVAFWAGACLGLVFGIMVAAIFAATARNIEGGNDDDRT